MRVSIITSTKNRKKSLSETLSHFYRVNTYPEELLEYIVVNDSDEDLDDILELYKGKTFSIVKNEGKGLAAGRNTGSRLSTGSLIIYLDDDILITPDHISKHVDAHNLFDICIVTAHREFPDNLLKEMKKTPFGRYKKDHDYIWYEKDESTILEKKGDRFIKVSGLAGFSCSLKKRTYDLIGEFNEKFPAVGNEDLDFYWRATQKGIKLIYDSHNLCFHNEFFNLAIDTWLKRQREGMESFMILCDIYPEQKKSTRYYPNTPITSKDPARLIFRKIIKRGFAMPIPYSFLIATIKALNRLNIPDIIMTKLFNVVAIVNFQMGYNNYMKKNKS
jgi:glycosyltransferase involved in cell wall biosynthesis